MGNLWIDLQSPEPTVKGDLCIKRPISDEEARVFGVADLKQVIVNYYHKQSPNHVWIRPPAHCYNEELFGRYNITPVNITLKFNRGNIKQTVSSSEIVQRNLLTNRSSVKATLHSDISVTKEHILSSTFDTTTSLTAGFKLGMNVKVFTAEASFEYSNTWGESYTSSKSVTLGSSAGVNVELMPGQSVEVLLKATKISTIVEVIYEANLSESFTIVYDNKYDFNQNKDYHHVWFPTIPNYTKDIKEMIKIDAYGKTDILVIDPNTKAVLKTVPYTSEMETIILSHDEAIAGSN